MKVITSNDDEVVFDNGLSIIGKGEQDCCAINYIDFEQFSVGREFPDMTLQELDKAITIKEDGIILKDSSKVPAWGQARSDQNGYYSSLTEVYVTDGKEEIRVGGVFGEHV